MMSAKTLSFHGRQELVFPGSFEKSLTFALDDLALHLKQALEKQAHAHLALSGGSTPLKVFSNLAKHPGTSKIDWSRVKVFWGDERFVPPDNPENNYFAAMQAGLSQLPLLPEHLFPIPTLSTPQKDALHYQNTLLKELPKGQLDYLMLGLGEDGHTASLFPKSPALEVSDQWVTSAKIGGQYRISMTLSLLNQSCRTCFYVMGSRKQEILKKLCQEQFQENRSFPATLIRIPSIWIVDSEAAQDL